MKKQNLYGKPMSYWEDMARDIVVSALVRAGSMYEQDQDHIGCLPHDIASKQLMSLAKGVSEPLFNKALEERDRCRISLAIFRAGPSSPRRAPRKKTSRRRKS